MHRPVNIAFGWRLPAWLLDFGPVVFIVFVGAWAIVVQRQSDLDVSVGVLWLGLAVSAVALVLRHRAPVLVLGVVLAIVLAVNNLAVMILPTLLALLAVAEERDRVKVAGATIATAAAMVAVGPLHGTSYGAPAVLSRLIAVGLPVAVGLYMRARADHIGGLGERAERLERERELLANQAVAEERVRIARELHDVVAHNVALMVVQTQALAATSRVVRDPDGGWRVAHHDSGRLRRRLLCPAPNERVAATPNIRSAHAQVPHCGVLHTGGREGRPERRRDQ